MEAGTHRWEGGRLIALDGRFDFNMNNGLLSMSMSQGSYRQFLDSLESLKPNIGGEYAGRQAG